MFTCCFLTLPGLSGLDRLQGLSGDPGVSQLRRHTLPLVMQRQKESAVPRHGLAALANLAWDSVHALDALDVIALRIFTVCLTVALRAVH